MKSMLRTYIYIYIYIYIRMNIGNFMTFVPKEVALITLTR